MFKIELEDDEEMTEEEIAERENQRKAERKHFNKCMKWGLILGSSVLAVILVKFCIAKRRRGRRCDVRNLEQMNQQAV